MITGKRLKIGVVGLGSMGQNHARIASNHQLAKELFVFDQDAVRAEDIAQKYDCVAVGSYEELLEKVDAVIIASSTLSHYSLAKQALSAGRHCLIEKPITATITEAQEILALSKENGCVVAVGHVERYNPVFTELAKILKSEKVLAVTAQRLSYNLSRANDVSVVLDLMIHDIDTICQIARSELQVVSAVGQAFRSVTSDFVSTLLTGGDGAIYNLIASKVSQTRVRSLCISCEQCYIDADYLKKEIQIFRHASGKYLDRSQQIGYRQEALVERVIVPNTEPLLAEHTDFYQAVLNNEEPLVTAQHGIRALELAEEIETKCA